MERASAVSHCFKCKRSDVPLVSAGPQAGHVCRPCKAERARQFRATKSGAESNARYLRDYIANNREKARAWNRVYDAVRLGRLAKPANCERCGESNQRIHAHHEDYSKPLEVKWLCPVCHNIRHRELAMQVTGVARQ